MSTSAICVMNASSPDRPSPQPTTTSAGPAGVSSRHRAATANVSTMVNTSEDGMNRSIVVFSGRMARLKNVPSRAVRPEGPGVGGRVDVADMRLLFRVRGHGESDVDHSRRSIVVGGTWAASLAGSSLTRVPARSIPQRSTTSWPGSAGSPGICTRSWTSSPTRDAPCGSRPSEITVPRPGTSPVAGLMLGIQAAFAEFARRRIKERQAEGIALGRVVSFQALLSMALPSPLWWSTALERGPRALGAWHDRVSKPGLPGHA